MKKTFILLTSLLFLVLSMSVSVFAWFTKVESNGSTSISGSVENGVRIDVTQEFEGIFDNVTYKHLVYVNEKELEENSNFISGLATEVHIKVKNQSHLETTVFLDLVVKKEEPNARPSGPQEGLVYLVHSENTSYILDNLSNKNKDLKMVEKINEYNYAGIKLKPEEEKEITIAVWGNHTQLQEEYKTIYHSLVYRTILKVTGGIAK
ncbi:conserved hypothetical protein [Alteracholeplasma palmae J233]|uniref:Uncharacterized protein n=1 Tax=Alteracholeplasma palmae (strain ATCC 49389 / J233) TaxID=1318466 RepID=U4KRF6_ALTPJ|nr:hypothetical protein [Alteracholeplasma palmae]CCV64121.1 conserved hypothetical protein [Alteracholeplasma palmae J233]